MAQAMLEGFGAKLRRYREERNLTLKELAENARVSIGILSQIERGLSSPSLKTVEKVRNALGLRIGDLFSDEKTPADDQSSLGAIVCRQEERPQLHIPNNNISKALLHRNVSRVFEMMIITLPPGSSTRNSCYPSEKGGMILKGEIEMTIGEETCTLHEGDSFLFDGNRTHNIANQTSMTAEVMWVVAKLPNEILY
ncbi:helix-turn-helix domain-containing protein [Robbsia sp. Bb-Pol-6]|uniref:Helix-turn-helix domain-containing protein n=1 Tax=Robbsia betulipollinis TaxID=2981849 RepID=A0ABT3ZSA0_9BURK|nr:cupin domain-containing protein [Robbsia betulipollinis]MCY0389352.1 helix-turn-helix domain-containing protein [Robbsia betulipollinis]